MRKLWVLILSLALAFSLSLATGCKKKEMTEVKETTEEAGTEMKQEGAEQKMEEGGQTAAPEEPKAGGYQ